MNAVLVLRVLQVKIAVTLLLWAMPLALMPQSWFGFFGPVPPVLLFIRLLAVAYFSLLVVYVWGLVLWHKRQNLRGVLLTGLVSNGGAAMILILYRIQVEWGAWTIAGKIYLWASLLITTAFALLMLLLLPMKSRT